MSYEEVILVNEQDETVGTAEKMAAHQQGLLHRAFSIFIFDSEGRMLLQQRAAQKYHGGLLWTNACCSHPRWGEEVSTATHRRLLEELGFDTALQKIFDFRYNEAVENGLIEHEYDHVFVGWYEGSIAPSREEVADYRYQEMTQIGIEVEENPEKFTTWFRIAFPKVQAWYKGVATQKKLIV